MVTLEADTLGSCSKHSKQEKNRLKLGHKQNAWKVCLCRKTARLELVTGTGVRIPPCFLVWGDLVHNGANNLSGKGKLLPGERHSEPSISSNIPPTGAFLVPRNRFPETPHALLIRLCLKVCTNLQLRGPLSFFFLAMFAACGSS